MKKTGIYNSEISALVANLGHKDMIAIADLGLPIPFEVKKIDISLDLGKPTVVDTLRVILKELKLEGIILSKEIKDKSPDVYEEILRVLKEQNENPEVTLVTHEEFKELIKKTKGVVRTGDNRPYSNIILVSGVIF